MSKFVRGGLVNYNLEKAKPYTPHLNSQSNEQQYAKDQFRSQANKALNELRKASRQASNIAKRRASQCQNDSGYMLLGDPLENSQKINHENRQTKPELALSGNNHPVKGPIQRSSIMLMKRQSTTQVRQDYRRSHSEEEVFQFKLALQKENIKCLIRVNGKWRTRWDIFMTFLAVWNSFAIPYQIAFEPPWVKTWPSILLTVLIDIVFLIDIIINFRTTYIQTLTGEQIIDPAYIARNYLKTLFFIDLIACLPLDYIISTDNQVANAFLSSLNMVKIIRIARIQKVIRYMNVKLDVKMILRLARLFFFMVLYIHINSCIWFMIVKDDQIWVPPYTAVDMLDFNPFYVQDLSYQYWFTLYHGILMIAGNDIYPQTTKQAVFVVISLIVGAIINANIFGNMAVLISNINKNSNLFQEQIDMANTAMKNMKLPEQVQHKVVNYMLYTQSTLDHQRELDSFLSTISPSLRLDVIRYIFANSIKGNKVFRLQNEGLIDFMIHKLITLLYLPEDCIIKQGDIGLHLFFIAKGECQVIVRDNIGFQKPARLLKPGMLFGEVALIANCRRTATVKALNYCTIAGLSAINFLSLCNRYPDTLNKLKVGMMRYNDNWKKFLQSCINRIFHFQDIKGQALEELTYSLRQQFFQKKTIIFKAGDHCKDVKIVTNGTVMITLSLNQQNQIVIDTLKQGGILSVYSWIHGHKYSFTARAKSNVTLQVLPRQAIYDLKTPFVEVDNAIKRAEKYISDNGVPLCDYIIRMKREQSQVLHCFRTVVEKIKMLNFYKSQKSLKLTDIMNKINDQKKKQSNEKKQKLAKNLFRKKIAYFISKEMNSSLAKQQKSTSLTMQVNKAMIQKMKRMTDVIQEQSKAISQLTKTVQNLKKSQKQEGQQQIDSGS